MNHEYYSSQTGHIAGRYGRTWYQLFGKKRSDAVVFIHGGPGSSHFSGLPLRALSREIPVLFYDQIGCGLSDRPKGTAFAKLSTFGDELELIRRTLGITRLHLIGHSWGAVIAATYWKHHARHVQSIVFSSPLLSTRKWEEDAKLLCAKLPETARSAIAKANRSQRFHSPEFRRATQLHFRRHVFRRKEFSPEMQISAFNETLYHRLWGPSEFLCTGSLKRFNAEPILRTIDVPTMFLRGEHDEVMKDTLSSFAQLVPKSQLKTLAGCSHLGYQEEPAAYLQTIRGFLRRLKRTR